MNYNCKHYMTEYGRCGHGGFCESQPNCAEKRAEKYKQALRNIKERAKEKMCLCLLQETDCKHCKKKNHCDKLARVEIMTIVNEALKK